MKNGKVQVAVNYSTVNIDSDFDQSITVALLLHAATKIIKEENLNNDDKVTAFEFAQLALESYEY